MKGLEAPRYADVKAPALAFYAGWTSPERALSTSWWRGMSASDQALTRGVLREMQDRMRAERDRFSKGVPGAIVVDLPEANHFVWLSDRERVLTEMHSFLAR